MPKRKCSTQTVHEFSGADLIAVMAEGMAMIKAGKIGDLALSVRPPDAPMITYKELRRRSEDLLSGKVKGIPLEKAMVAARKQAGLSTCNRKP